MPEDEKVGYGKPPKNHQFKKGQSGNRKGRPKGRKSKTDCMLDALNRRVTVRDGNRTRAMTKLEVIIETTINKAMQGDPRACAEVFKFLEKVAQYEIANDKHRPSGVLLLPASPLDPEEWERAVAKHQAKARGEVE